MFADAAEFWTEYSFQIEDIIDAGEHVITIGHVVGRGKGSGVPVDQRLATAWSFEGSEAVSAKTYPSKARGPRIRGAVGVGDVAGERRSRASRIEAFNAGDWIATSAS